MMQTIYLYHNQLPGRWSLAFVFALLIASCGSPEKQQFTNRLKDASSMYLKEHAGNPVDWYEWGDEALAKAKKENKPLLISIGYSSCHWCHVMAKESFSDTAVARIMNESFVCIKVDREERPDIDKLYMHACQILNNGAGGWPLNAFALPDGKPFFAGTYYSKSNWINLLTQVADSYKNKNGKVVMQANSITYGIIDNDSLLFRQPNTQGTINKSDYDVFYTSLQQAIDHTNGGLKGNEKFPNPSLWQSLLQHQYFTGNAASLKATLHTLDKMALGALYDHLGGGFCRYTTDSLWRHPHFEKMLYDNGQLISLYSQAYKITGNEFYKKVVTETISFVEKELSGGQGAFYSSLNADTKEGEGAYYLWDYNEFQAVAGPQYASAMAKYFNVAPAGNIAAEAGTDNHKNVLYTTALPAEFSVSNKLSQAEFSSALEKFEKALLIRRRLRTKPSVDTKIIAGWNAMMLKGYADAFAATGNKQHLEAAINLATFIEQKLLAADGKLLRSYSPGNTSLAGFLEDYACVAMAYVQLYQVTFNKHWLELSKKIADYAVLNFYDKKSGMFYFAPLNAQQLVINKQDVRDGEIPSSNAMMATVLYKLGVFFEDENFNDISSRMLNIASAAMLQSPAYYSQWYTLAGLMVYGSKEVAIMGTDAIGFSTAMQKKYLPECLFMGERATENLPLLKGKLPQNGTMIYVCSGKVCKLPVNDVEKAFRQIDNGGRERTL